MTRNAVILDGAKGDFRDIRKYVKKQFGDLVWVEVNQEFKDAIKRVSDNPMLGTHLEELAELGYGNFRKILVRQTRVVYEFDNQQLIVHMFIHTKKDFKTHLTRRLLAPVW
jgi:plasmid stabilization system protein ParE